MSDESNRLPPEAAEPKKPEEDPPKLGLGDTVKGIFALIIGGAFLSWWMTPSVDSAHSNTQVSNYTVAQKLAIIDRRQGHEREYDRLLDILTVKCSDTRIGVSDTAVRGTQVMQERRNIKMSALEFLEALDGSIPDEGAGVVNCKEIAAAFITLTGSK